VIRVQGTPAIDDSKHHGQQENNNKALLDQAAPALPAFATDRKLRPLHGPFELESAGH
jgi:hypothetical protein